MEVSFAKSWIFQDLPTIDRCPPLEAKPTSGWCSHPILENPRSSPTKLSIIDIRDLFLSIPMIQTIHIQSLADDPNETNESQWNHWSLKASNVHQLDAWITSETPMENPPDRSKTTQSFPKSPWVIPIIINHQDIQTKSSNSHQMIFHLPSGVIKHGVLENTPSELVQ